MSALRGLLQEGHHGFQLRRRLGHHFEDAAGVVAGSLDLAVERLVLRELGELLAGFIRSLRQGRGEGDDLAGPLEDFG